MRKEYKRLLKKLSFVVFALFMVGVKEVSAHFQSDSPGSREEYTK